MASVCSLETRRCGPLLDGPAESRVAAEKRTREHTYRYITPPDCKHSSFMRLKRFIVMQKFELIVIGTGPAGEKAAVKAAYFGHKVAIVEKEKIFGGAEVVTGTLPSKTLKETALFLSGKFEKGIYGVERDLEHA